MDIRSFKTDAAKETEGVWQPLGDGVELLIARMNNPACKRAFRRHAGRFKGMALELLPAEKQDEIYARVMAETVLLDWRETVDGDVRPHTITEDGKAVTYSADEAFRVLTAYPDIRDVVRIYAESADAYREEAIGDAAGN